MKKVNNLFNAGYGWGRTYPLKTRLKEEPIDYSKEYMYIEALEDGMTVSFTKNASSGSLYYSSDKQEWNELTGETPAINSGEKVYFKGDLVAKGLHAGQYGQPIMSGSGTFVISKQCNVCGNVMSLLFSDNFEDKTDLTGKNLCFYNLFNNCNTIRSAKNLILPATTLSYSCYHGMFNKCTNLTQIPELLATTLTAGCYNSMFRECTSLETAPSILPALKLLPSPNMYYGGCYNSMFQGCTGLTTAPELPATELADYCYQYMFQGCTNLTTVPELPATTLTLWCYYRMFKDCNGLTKAPELPATTLASSCYSGMFEGCTGLTVVPELPATTLAQSCYHSMFSGCISLTTAPELPAMTLANSCYGMMFSGCTNLISAPELPATTLVSNCYQYMFNNCSLLTTAPTLPATVLASSCYYGMFKGCNNLNYIKMFATNISASTCLNEWVDGVAPTGTFVKADGVEIPTGISGIPEGWTEPVWEVVRSLTNNDITYGVGTLDLTSSVSKLQLPYTRDTEDRAGYYYLDIPAEYGYKYKVAFESDVATVQCGTQWYTETFVKACEDFYIGCPRTTDCKFDPGWLENNATIIVPEKQNGSPIVGVQITFRINRLNFIIPNGTIKKFTLYRL